MPLIELRNISRNFGGVAALIDVSLTVNPGEIIGLVGDNGAGKSTLLGIIAGNFPPSHGSILLAGELIRFQSAADARRRGIETVYQHLALCDNLTAAANIFLGRELSRDMWLVRALDHAAMEATATELFATLKSDTPPGELVKYLSGGQRQAVAIARALLAAPRLMLLDEPIAALSSRQRSELLSMLRQLRDQNVAIVFVSHSLPDVLAVTSRVIFLRQGRKLLDCPTSETSEQELAKLLSEEQRGDIDSMLRNQQDG